MRICLDDFKYFWLHTAIAVFLLVALFTVPSHETAVAMAIWILLGYLALVKRFNYLDPLVGYLVPWIMILSFSLTRVSSFAVSIHRPTYFVIIIAILGALFVAGGRVRTRPIWRDKIKRSNPGLRPKDAFLLLDFTFASLTVFNIIAAGYIPLLRGLLTGNTGYLTFGIHGLYGFYLAFANALAIISLIIFLRTGKKSYLVRYFVIISIFVVLITRQNIISVAVESVISYSLIRKKIHWRTLFGGLALGAVLFSVMGSFRSGSVREIVGVEKAYSWIPEPVIWLYAYSYFNVANLDRMVTESDAPYYNGSSISSLVPSFLRPTYESQNYLLLSNFNVSSYMYPVYEDVGNVGVLSLTCVALWFTARGYRLLGQAPTISQIGIYSVLYFCASFSFFVNFWFYLPIIFQIVFFKMLANVSERACVPVTRLTSPGKSSSHTRRLSELH